MVKREILRNYIQDNFECYPGYYKWKKDYIMEFSWIHYTCQEVLYELALLPNDDMVMPMLEQKIKEAEMCLSKSKTVTSRILFTTERRILDELVGVLVAAQEDINHNPVL